MVKQNSAGKHNSTRRVDEGGKRIESPSRHAIKLQSTSYTVVGRGEKSLLSILCDPGSEFRLTTCILVGGSRTRRAVKIITIQCRVKSGTKKRKKKEMSTARIK